MDHDNAPVADLPRRFAAAFYDGLLLTGLFMVLTLVFVLARGGEAIPPGSWWFGVALLGASFLFFGFFWTRGGQTLGAKAWGLRVIAADGGGLNWRQAAIRYLAAWSLLFPPGLGFIWAWWDAERLCWHDRLSGSRVIRQRHPQASTVDHP